MPENDLQIEVAIAREHDVAAMHALCSSAFTLDCFSPRLFQEKLFKIALPGREQYRTYMASVDGQLVGMMQAVSRSNEGRGWVGLFAVATEWRRKGVATQLLEQAQADWLAEGVHDIEVLAIPGNYFTPGLDPRYTEALSFLERHRFVRFKDCVNLSVELPSRFETNKDEVRLEQAGVEVRRATTEDDARLRAFFDTEFGDSWLLESRQAVDNESPALHLALRDGRIVAFSAHSTQNREWGFFGPMGTLPETRGLGIGRVLLLRCLNDLREGGHKSAVIPWVGPIAFYSHHANARVDRVFWRYRKSLQPQP